MMVSLMLTRRVDFPDSRDILTDMQQGLFFDGYFWFARHHHVSGTK